MSKVIFNSFGWRHFNEHHSNHRFVIHIFEALMKSGWDDPISIDPRLSELIIGCVSINYVTRHFFLQVSDLTLETDLAKEMTTPSIEVI